MFGVQLAYWAKVPQAPFFKYVMRHSTAANFVNIQTNIVVYVCQCACLFFCFVGRQ